MIRLCIIPLRRAHSKVSIANVVLVCLFVVFTLVFKSTCLIFILLFFKKKDGIRQPQDGDEDEEDVDERVEVRPTEEVSTLARSFYACGLAHYEHDPK